MFTASESSNCDELNAYGECTVVQKREQVLDNAYNRYTSNDGPLPTWFEDEEDRHRQPQIPMTKEMARDIKEREREINARPIKKVMEAKARAKRNVHRQMEKLKSKATAITDNEALTGECVLSPRRVHCKGQHGVSHGHGGRGISPGARVRCDTWMTSISRLPLSFQNCFLFLSIHCEVVNGSKSKRPILKRPSLVDCAFCVLSLLTNPNPFIFSPEREFVLVVHGMFHSPPGHACVHRSGEDGANSGIVQENENRRKARGIV